MAPQDQDPRALVTAFSLLYDIKILLKMSKYAHILIATKTSETLQVQAFQIKDDRLVRKGTQAAGPKLFTSLSPCRTTLDGSVMTEVQASFWKPENDKESRTDRSRYTGDPEEPLHQSWPPLLHLFLHKENESLNFHPVF